MVLLVSLVVHLFLLFLLHIVRSSSVRSVVQFSFFFLFSSISFFSFSIDVFRSEGSGVYSL